MTAFLAFYGRPQGETTSIFNRKLLILELHIYGYTVNFKELNQLKKFYSVTKNGLKRLQNNTFGVDSTP